MIPESLALVQRRMLGAVLAAQAPEDARLAVYHHTALAARCAALAAAYPVVQRLVGESFFGEAARAHAHARPSASGDLHDYGAGLAAFLAAYPPAAALAYLADVARMEWAVHESRHAADAPPFDFAALGRLAPEELVHVCIELHPAVRLVESVHPVLAIWEANQEGRDGTPDRIDGGQRVIVRRSGGDVRPVEADRASWVLLEAFSRGATLGEGLDALSADGDAIDKTLARLADLEVLGGFTLGARA